MEDSVSDRKYDKNERNDEGKEAECLDDTSPVDIGEVVSDNKGENNEKMTSKKRQNAQMILPLLIWRKV